MNKLSSALRDAGYCSRKTVDQGILLECRHPRYGSMLLKISLNSNNTYTVITNGSDAPSNNTTIEEVVAKANQFFSRRES